MIKCLVLVTAALLVAVAVVWGFTGQIDGRAMASAFCYLVFVVASGLAIASLYRDASLSRR